MPIYPTVWDWGTALSFGAHLPTPISAQGNNEQQPTTPTPAAPAIDGDILSFQISRYYTLQFSSSASTSSRVLAWGRSCRHLWLSVRTKVRGLSCISLGLYLVRSTYETSLGTPYDLACFWTYWSCDLRMGRRSAEAYPCSTIVHAGFIHIELQQ